MVYSVNPGIRPQEDEPTSLVYFDWLKNYQKKLIFEDYLINAETRLQNVKKSFLEGDKPEIDTLEANINLTNRLLDLEKAKITEQE